ncbi:MAG TPA: VWA domain-containing protein [Terriglobales bacterium]|nr:VWA domain-containing protein [Terriglobales bacterium]
MKSCLSWLMFAFFLLVTVVQGQNQSPQELPSAPSATKQPSQPSPRAPEPPPASPPETSKAAAQPADSAKTDASLPPAPPADSTPTPEAPPATRAVAPSSTAGDESVTIHRTVNEVNVVFTVTDKHGRYVKDLKKEDFKIIDDAKPAEEIRSFRAETDLPLELGLLIDASNSVRDRFKFEQEAAVEFLNQTIRVGYDSAFVIGFDVTPEVTQEFTDNTEALSNGVRMLRPGGGTALYDALYYACREKLSRARRNGPVRKSIILLSDGDDNQSHVTREEAIEMAQRAEVVVYTISTNLSGTGSHGDKVLERIADATGGRAYIPFQLTEVANDFANIQEELRSQYSISYKPADFHPDGRYRTIQIIALEKGLHVRSRRGWFAPSQ